MKKTSETFIALLRGINVSGHKPVPMSELRSLCERLRWTGVQTYIQSGNVVFTAAAAPAVLEAELDQAIERRFSFSVPVIIRAASDWPAFVKSNPFPEASAAEPNHVMLVLSKMAPKPGAATALQERAAAGEQVVQAGGALWIHFGGDGGVAKSKLSPTLLDRLIGSTATARNWRTVLKLAELSHGPNPEASPG